MDITYGITRSEYVSHREFRGCIARAESAQQVHIQKMTYERKSI